MSENSEVLKREFSGVDNKQALDDSNDFNVRGITSSLATIYNISILTTDILT